MTLKEVCESAHIASYLDTKSGTASRVYVVTLKFHPIQAMKDEKGLEMKDVGSVVKTDFIMKV